MTTRFNTFRLSLCGLFAVTLAACDQQQERADRASGLAWSVIDQLLGNESETAAEDRLRAVDVEDRAMAGMIQPQSVDAPAGDRPANRFVIGSIVAKPRDLPPPVAMASVMAEPELLMRSSSMTWLRRKSSSWMKRQRRKRCPIRT